MKKIKFRVNNSALSKTVLRICMLFLITTSLAHGAANTPTGKIYNINVGDVVLVKLNDSNGNRISVNLLGCANDSGTFVLARENNELFDDLYRALVLARGINANVKLWITECYTQSNGKIRGSIGSVNIF